MERTTIYIQHLRVQQEIQAQTVTTSLLVWLQLHIKMWDAARFFSCQVLYAWTVYIPSSNLNAFRRKRANLFTSWKVSELAKAPMYFEMKKYLINDLQYHFMTTQSKKETFYTVKCKISHQRIIIKKIWFNIPTEYRKIMI